MQNQKIKGAALKSLVSNNALEHDNTKAHGSSSGWN
jgi:hypothetical protein